MLFFGHSWDSINLASSWPSLWFCCLCGWENWPEGEKDNAFDCVFVGHCCHGIHLNEHTATISVLDADVLSLSFKFPPSSCIGWVRRDDEVKGFSIGGGKVTPTAIVRSISSWRSGMERECWWKAQRFPGTEIVIDSKSTIECLNFTKT